MGPEETTLEAEGGENGPRTAWFLWICDSCECLHPRWPHPLGFKIYRFPSWGWGRSPEVSCWEKTSECQNTSLGSSGCCFPSRGVVLSSRGSKIILFPPRQASLLCVWLGEGGKCGSAKVQRPLFVSIETFFIILEHIKWGWIYSPEAQDGLPDGGGRDEVDSTQAVHCTIEQHQSHTRVACE